MFFDNLDHVHGLREHGMVHGLSWCIYYGGATMTLGQTIGKVRHTFSITNDAKDKVQLAVTIDFSTASDTDIKSWLVSNRVIAGQRPWRALSKDEIESLDGQTILATDIGKKIKSREERIATYTALGLPRDLAELAVDDPGRFQELVGKVNTQE